MSTSELFNQWETAIAQALTPRLAADLEASELARTAPLRVQAGIVAGGRPTSKYSCVYSDCCLISTTGC